MAASILIPGHAMKTVIQTAGAPAAIGAYSQAVRAGDTVYLSGQIGLDPASTQLVEGIDAQIERVFANLAAVARAAGLDLGSAVRMTVYLTDLAHFAKVNEAMARHVPQPFPARAAVSVASLPRGALVEIDAILHAG
jgi:reactive intermediate/imine deaminase